MAKAILRNVFITVNGVDLSAHFSQVELDEKFDEVDVTGFGANFKETLLGIGDGSISGTVFQDFAAGSVDATLGPLVGSNTPFLVEVRPTSSGRSVTNPGYVIEAVLPEYKPLAGSVGSASTTSVSFRNATQKGIERLTS